MRFGLASEMALLSFAIPRHDSNVGYHAGASALRLREQCTALRGLEPHGTRRPGPLDDYGTGGVRLKPPSRVPPFPVADERPKPRYRYGSGGRRESGRGGDQTRTGVTPGCFRDSCRRRPSAGPSLAAGLPTRSPTGVPADPGPNWVPPGRSLGYWSPVKWCLAVVEDASHVGALARTVASITVHQRLRTFKSVQEQP